MFFNLPLKELAFVNTNNKWLLEKGDFKISINKLHQDFTWGGKYGVDDKIFPQKMEIDYVRVYQ